jgi:hypothetical protein
MADWYCDPTLAQVAYGDYSATPVAAGTVPTKCEDGNGKGTGVATMATLVITFTGLPAADQAITVAGVTFTAKASGATGNQFNAVTDAATCAANLKNAINASTTNAIKPTAEIASTAPLRNIVNATSSGGTVTVYTRIGSAAWNSVTETSTLSNCSVTQWSGGGDGAWGYFFNPSAIAFPGSVSAGAYGAFPGSYIGQPVAGDVIHIRTKRSGSNVAVTWPASNLAVTARSVGTTAAPLAFLADNGVKWSGDAGVFTLSLDASVSVNRSLTLPVATVKQIWAGVKLGATACNWRHELTGAVTTSTNYRYVVGGSSTSAASFLEIVAQEVTGASGAVLNNTNNTNAYFAWQPSGALATGVRDVPAMVLRDCYFRSAGRVSPYGHTMGGGSSYSSLRAINCVSDHTGCTLASNEAIIHSVTPTPSSRYEFISCRFLGFPAAANLSGMNGATAKYTTLILQDTTFDNIKLFGGPANGGLLGTAEDTSNSNVDALRSIRVSSTIGNRPMIFETARWAMGWFDAAAPKIASTLLPDGTTAFSLRTAVTTETGNVSVHHPVRFPRIGVINSLADGTRTVTLPMLVDNNIRTTLGARDPYNTELWIEVHYVGTDGLPKMVTSKPALGAAASAIAAGTAGDWTATAYDVNGVSHGYTAFQLSVSCPDMEGGCELGIYLHQGFAVGSTDDLIFLSGWGVS